MTKVGLISLGCDKNRVDSERILFSLANNGYELTEDVSDADVVIVNTCAFIGDAKKESIDNILEMAELKKTSLKKLIDIQLNLTKAFQDLMIRDSDEQVMRDFFVLSMSGNLS